MLNACKKIYRNGLLQLRLLRTSVYHAYAFGSSAPRKNEVIYIDPKLIKGHMGASLAVWNALIAKTGCEGGAIIGGNWDRDNVEYLSFYDLEVYKSCYAHWVDGKPWDETPFFQKYVKRLELGQPNRFKSLEELRERYNRLDIIYDAVNVQRKMSAKRGDLVKISISRDGSLIWGPDGKHRVSIALCIGLNKIPARVGFVHVDAIDAFQELRRNNITSEPSNMLLANQ